MMILIISNTQDLTCDFVVRELHRRKLPFSRLNTDEFPINGFGTVLYCEDRSNEFIRWKNRKDRLNFSNITAVWYRRPTKPRVSNEIRKKSIAKFCVDESYDFLRGIWYKLNCFWMSDPAAIRKSEHKIFQLEAARKLKFTIPHTLISNDPEEVTEFIEQCKNNVIIKPIYMGYLEADKPYWVYTSSLSKSDIKSKKSIEFTPSIYQEKIDKLFDIRITVVDDMIFSARIDAKHLPANIPDWRYLDIKKLKHSKYKLPSEIEILCHKLVRELGLSFGAIDMALDKDGRYIFFEINPNGQWAWLERALDFKISSSIVDSLIKKRN